MSLGLHHALERGGDAVRSREIRPLERVTGWDTPYPHALEWAYFPGPDRVAAALKRVMEP